MHCNSDALALVVALKGAEHPPHTAVKKDASSAGSIDSGNRSLSESTGDFTERLSEVFSFNFLPPLRRPMDFLQHTRDALHKQNSEIVMRLGD